MFSAAQSLRTVHRIFQQGSPRAVAARGQNKPSLSAKAIAKVPPHVALFAVLAARKVRSGPSGLAGMKARAPFQRALAPSIGKWAN